MRRFTSQFNFKQIRRLFIKTEPTPNPNSQIFRPTRPLFTNEVSSSGPFEIISPIEAAKKSPLADELFKIEGVRSVLVGRDFLTISKENSVEWQQLNAQIYAAVMDFFTTGQPAILDTITDDKSGKCQESSLGEDSTVQLIKEILDTRIRPTVQDDGGDVEFRGVEDGWVKLRLIGACRDCSSSTITLRNGIESMLMHYIPEVKGVIQVE